LAFARSRSQDSNPFSKALERGKIKGKSCYPRQMSENQDYYKILNVSENADLEEIKRSFRRLARDCHPDLHPNDVGAAERFRLLREAYEVLSDAVRRRNYDRLRQKRLSFEEQPASNAQVYYVRGVEKSLVRNYRGAITSLSEAIRLDPLFVEAYLKRCEAYLAIGDERSALEDTQQVLRYRPDSAIAYYYQGRARQRLGYAESAIQAYSKAIRSDQTFAPSYYYRGVAHHELRYSHRAISDWREYVELCKKQGDISGYRLGMDALSQYSWIPIRIGNRTPGQWWRWTRTKMETRFQRDHRPPFQPWKMMRKQIKQTWNECQITIKLGFSVIFQVIRNPAGGILPAYGSLTPTQAAIIACGLILISEIGFLAGMLSRFAVSWEVTIRWLAVGLIPVLSLFAISFITHSLLQHPRHWAGDLFFAGSAVLPLGFLFFLSTFLTVIPNLIFFVLGVFGCSHTLLILYGGCSQLLNASESLTAIIVPIIIIVTALLTWVGVSLLL